MTRAGGPADKYGNRFEGRWTIHCLTELLRGVAEKIVLEPPGEAGEGVEFVLWRDGKAEHHQVKGGRSRGQWTIQRLSREGVLENFKSKLRGDPKCVCILVTESPADELHELTVRARESSSGRDLADRLSDPLMRALQRLQAAWPGLTADELVAALARVRNVQWSEEALKTLLSTELEGLIQGSPGATLSVIAQFALDRLSGTVIAGDLWTHLKGEGLRPVNWLQDTSVAQALSDAAQRYLRPHRDEAILGSAIPRAEASEVLQLLSGETPRVVLVTGKGGIGKSGLAAQVVETLLRDGYPVLPLRSDLLKPTQLPEDVGKQVGLPGSPVSVLGVLAAGRRSVLVLDQLDSVSLTSGRHPEFWHCLREIIDGARCQQEMSVLIVCRRFDLENDDRLRALSAQSGGPAIVIEVGPFANETVNQVVSAAGLAADSLRPSQRALLAVPLHLRLLTLMAAESEKRGLHFDSARDLFDRFWEHKRQRIAQRAAPRTIRWAETLEAICELMSEAESLSVARARLDRFADEIPMFISEHVLVEDAQRVAFFHQAFFDYVFARGFRARQTDLLDYLLGADQGLFRRGQVRQVLAYGREEDNTRYLRDLGSMLGDHRIRFHIKRAALDWLTTVSSPWLEEWAILERALESGGDIRRHILNLVAGSPAWFDLVYDQGTVARWLSADEEERINEAVSVLGRVQRTRPARVAESLTPYVDKSQDWNRRLWWLTSWAELGTDRAFFDFFLRLLHSGVLDDLRGPIAVNSDFWALVYPLPEKRPDWACELIGAYLDRRLRLADKVGVANPFDRASGTIPDTQHHATILDAATRAPKAFVTHVLPFILEVVDRNVDRSKPTPRRDAVWSFRYPGEAHTLESAALLAMEVALKGLAASESDVFVSLVDKYSQRGSDTIDFLLARGYLGAPQSVADAAVEFLLAVPDRLHLGYASETSWASRELLAWAFPICSPPHRQRVLSMVLTFYPAWERSVHGYRSRGRCQYVVLTGIPEELLSAEAKRRVQELKRKFGPSAQAPESPEVSAVESPISQQGTERMTDEQWLKAMARYSSEWGDLSRGARGGGALELARLLAGTAREHPGRFVSLIESAPDDLNPEYFAAVVGAVGDPASGADITTLFRACQRADALAARPCGLAIVRAVQQRASAPLPNELVEMVGRYALQDADPATETWEEMSASGQPFYLGDIYTAGINCTRGAAAECIAAILLSEHDRRGILKPVLERLVEDAQISVRACAAKCLVALLNRDHDLALGLFLRLVDTRDALLGTPYIERFLYYTVLPDFARVAPVIERMVKSQIDDVAKAGARQGCLASLELDDARDLRNRCMSGRTSLRSGAAKIFASNLRSAGHRTICEQSLRDFIQ